MRLTPAVAVLFWIGQVHIEGLKLQPQATTMTMPETSSAKTTVTSSEPTKFTMTEASSSEASTTTMPETSSAKFTVTSSEPTTMTTAGESSSSESSTTTMPETSSAKFTVTSSEQTTMTTSATTPKETTETLTTTHAGMSTTTKPTTKPPPTPTGAAPSSAAPAPAPATTKPPPTTTAAPSSAAPAPAPTTTLPTPVTSNGALYTRWGRRDCGLLSDKLVYIGIVGGSKGKDYGGAANTLCMPRDPEWGSYDDDENIGGLVYGTEYQTQNFNPFLNGDPTDQNAPCAVCKSTVFASTLMLPARQSCYDGWMKAYSGYLMSESSDNYRTEYVCVDGNPEVNAAGAGDQSSNHWFPVEGRCGSLPCPPYVNGRELTCVVCLQ